MISLIIALSLLIGLSLGLLGGGGSILTIPILVYALGVEEKAAIPSSLLIVGLTSAAAMLSHARAGRVQWSTGILFGVAGMIGACAGGRLSAFLPTSLLLGFLALVMVAAAVAMLRGRKMSEQATKPLDVPKALAIGIGVGVLTGLLGAGGGFLIVPALVFIGGLPMRQAVGTSLFIIATNSFFGFLGHTAKETVDYSTTLLMAGIAIVGSLVGERLACKVSQQLLRRAFAYFVLAAAGFLLFEQAFGR